MKYSVKGTDLAACSGRIGPLIRALEGCRLLTTFGNAYRLGRNETPGPSLAEPEPDENGDIATIVGHNCCAYPHLLPSEVLKIMMLPAKTRR